MGGRGGSPGEITTPRARTRPEPRGRPAGAPGARARASAPGADRATAVRTRALRVRRHRGRDPEGAVDRLAAPEDPEAVRTHPRRGGSAARLLLPRSGGAAEPPRSRRGAGCATGFVHLASDTGDPKGRPMNERTLQDDTSVDDIRTLVREKYGSIARGDRSCCGSGVDAMQDLGYTDSQSAAAPAGANLGLGCGNPIAHAQLRPGETVLDLGSGGGLDVFLAAREGGPQGRSIGVDMTPDMLAPARANARP